MNLTRAPYPWIKWFAPSTLRLMGAASGKWGCDKFGFLNGVSYVASLLWPLVVCVCGGLCVLWCFCRGLLWWLAFFCRVRFDLCVWVLVWACAYVFVCWFSCLFGMLASLLVGYSCVCECNHVLRLFCCFWFLCVWLTVVTINRLIKPSFNHHFTTNHQHLTAINHQLTILSPRINRSPSSLGFISWERRQVSCRPVVSA